MKEFLKKMISGKSDVSSKRINATVGHIVAIIYLFTLGGPNFAAMYLGFLAALMGLTVIDGFRTGKDNIKIDKDNEL